MILSLVGSRRHLHIALDAIGMFASPISAGDSSRMRWVGIFASIEANRPLLSNCSRKVEAAKASLKRSRMPPAI